jgi:hypothetical protein
MSQDRTCAIADCESPAYRRSWCNAHYLRWRRHGDPLAGGASHRAAPSPICSAENCDRPHLALGWCQMHYRRQYATGGVNRSDGSEATERGRCGHEGCSRPASLRGGVCDAHQKRARRGREAIQPVGAFPGKPVTTIRAAHRALARERGPAREWCCATCSLPAAEWAFVGVEREDFRHPQLGYFSTDFDEYVPLCVSCHRARDAVSRQVRRYGHAGCVKCSGPYYCRGLCKVHYDQAVWAERTAREAQKAGTTT